MQPAHSVSDQISASANRFPGDGRHWDLGDSRAEPSVTGRSDRTLLLTGKREGIKAPNSCSGMPAVHCHPALGTAGEALKLGKRDISVSLALCLQKHTEPQTREGAMVEGPRNSCWCQLFLFLPCMFPVGAEFTLAWGISEEAHSLTVLGTSG